MSTDSGFRQYLFDSRDPRVSELVGLDAYEYREVAKQGDFTGGLIRGWQELYPAEFRGVTVDGELREGLFPLQAQAEEDGAPVRAMTVAANTALEAMSTAQRAAFCYPVGAVEWQSWANPEFLQHDTGLRLEVLEPALRETVLDIVRASMSPNGWSLAQSLMRINGFLGDVVGLAGIMNEYSYNVALYGEPSEESPWGWQLFGHHVAMNCLVVGTQMVFTPVFFGAEPDHLELDGVTGPPVFEARVGHARAVMAALDEDQRASATTYEQMVDPAMPAGRIHPGDERHLAGAFQDNRVIPYEGLRVADMSPAARDAVERLVAEFTSYLPDGPARIRREEIARYYDETWFSWIGGHGPDDVFYVRVQSPVVILELDHHTGVFLTNEEPAPFHIHTVIRTPNGNDYGKQLVAQYEKGVSS